MNGVHHHGIVNGQTVGEYTYQLEVHKIAFGGRKNMVIGGLAIAKKEETILVPLFLSLMRNVHIIIPKETGKEVEPMKTCGMGKSLN